jgi:hypothetical protein
MNPLDHQEQMILPLPVNGLHTAEVGAAPCLGLHHRACRRCRGSRAPADC